MVTKGFAKLCVDTTYDSFYMYVYNVGLCERQ